MIDRVLGRLGARWLRRGLAGDPLLIVLWAGTWAVRRARRRRSVPLWSGRLSPGERILVSAWPPGEGPPAPTRA